MPKEKEGAAPHEVTAGFVITIVFQAQLLPA